MVEGPDAAQLRCVELSVSVRVRALLSPPKERPIFPVSLVRPRRITSDWTPGIPSLHIRLGLVETVPTRLADFDPLEWRMSPLQAS